jgi:hypothetical protein
LSAFPYPSHSPWWSRDEEHAEGMKIGILKLVEVVDELAKSVAELVLFILKGERLYLGDYDLPTRPYVPTEVYVWQVSWRQELLACSKDPLA